MISPQLWAGWQHLPAFRLPPRQKWGKRLCAWWGPLAGGVFPGGPLPLIAPPPSPFASQRRGIWLQSPDSHSREGVCPAWEGCPGPVMGENRPTGGWGGEADFSSFCRAKHRSAPRRRRSERTVLGSWS